MKKTSIRLLSILMALTLCLSLSLLFTVSAEGEADGKDVTVLFTHDLHSHFLPSAKEGGGEFGGFARLATVIRAQKALYPDALLLDGGDFSMGSLFQTAYATSALELRMLGSLGYDATTFGNHEFDYLPEGVANMLNAAVASGDRLPALVDANYLPPKEGEEGYDETDAKVWDALNNYGVKDYILLERGGVHFAIFGITGFDSDACAPNSGMILKDPATVAQATVDAAIADCLAKNGVEPLVICLSHSGTENRKGEDYELAKAVKGIDLIVSGHTHTTLTEEITVGSTHIVSAGEYGKNLGVVQMKYDGKDAVLTDYDLIAIDEKVAADPEIESLVATYKSAVEEDYLSKFNMKFDQVLANNTYRFDSVKEVYATQHESTLGNLYSDAYKWAAEKTLGKEIAVALTAAGVIRETMPIGNITVSDVFNAASLGVGTEGELIAVYITGKDLRNALEVDASVQPLMSSAQLFFSGVEYSFNTRRMLFNKVDYAMLRQNDGSLAEIEDEKLYCVVTGMYAGQMLGSVESTSFGLISITPRDAEGNPLTADQLVNYVIKDEKGTPLKEWYAIASYIDEMEDDKMDEAYSKTDGRKVVYTSAKPGDLLRGANKFTVIVMIVINLAAVGIGFGVWGIVRRVKKKKAA